MVKCRSLHLLIHVWAGFHFVHVSPIIQAAEKFSYNNDIRPILSDKCFHCHGPDASKRKPKDNPLRLDTFEGATADRDGFQAIIPGKPDKSELISRIFTDNEDDLMPPPDSHRSLTQKQKNILKQWIKEGAQYEQHWAFVPPVKPKVPDLKGSDWPKNEIDHFVLHHLTKAKLQPSQEATKNTLIRRASLTLTGLQPTPKEVDTYLADTSADAYEKMLDRLLASPRYGEHMAYAWIEAARYADTDGYQNDGERTMWPWRDWVIKAFNDNMPYDQFSIRQLAGDMLPENDPQNLLASAFNRNHRINNEGGALPEEFVVEYAIDRVETTSTIWLGLTSGCARCHDHKYDPLSQKEFFQLYAYFNNIPEKGKDTGKNAAPSIIAKSPIYRDLKTEALITQTKNNIVQTPNTPAFAKRKSAWEKSLVSQYNTPNAPWRLGTLKHASATDLSSQKETTTKLNLQANHSILVNQANQNSRYNLTIVPPAGMKSLATIRLDTLQHPTLKSPLMFSRGPKGNFFMSELKLSIQRNGKQIPVMLGHAVTNFSQIYHGIKNITDGNANTGWAVGGYKAKAPLIVHVPLFKPQPLQEGDLLIVTMDFPSIKNPTTLPPNQGLGNFRVSFHSHTNHSKTNNHLPNHVATAVATPPNKRSDTTKRDIAQYYQKIDPALVKLRNQLSTLEKTISKFSVRVPIMREKPKPTPTYLLKRGQYHSPDKSEVLSRQIPPWLGRPAQQPANRLELARWFVSSKNPLGARVIVNRIWQQHFGVGLVKTADNFGVQGSLPSHPELLDWLATDFMENGWDLKRLHKQILSSATWKQSSQAKQTAYQADPENRLLARGPRFRLSAAAIRDSALYASGLLNPQMGGPPVKPYQPNGLWNTMAHAPNIRYVQSKGANLYRRDLYTYWKRAVNPPRMILFDAATRDYCSVLRKSTNTPLQALTSMNDVTFVEAARKLGERMMTSPLKGAEAKLIHGFRLATGRPPNPEESEIIKACFKDFWNYYKSKPEQAAAYVKHGASPTKAELKVEHHAAYMATAHLMLNMDSTLHIE